MQTLALSAHSIIIIVPVLGLVAQWLSWRFHLPAIVLLSLIGILIGPVAQWVQPDIHTNETLRLFIKFSVAIILFEGGLYLRLHELKEVFSGISRLIFPALPIAWLVYAVFSHFVGGISWPIALIFGAIIVVSGPTVVIPLLRQARLKRKSASYIKWEGIINDPIGALLAVLVFQFFLLTHLGTFEYSLVWTLCQGIALALCLGVGSGFILGYLYERGEIPEFLKPAIVFVVVILIYQLSNIVQEEAGLFAVTAFGLTLSNLKLPSINEIRRFNESLGIILISCLFILLTSSLKLEQLQNLNTRTMWLILSIMFVARPIVVLISSLGSKISWPDRVLLSWIAPRGVVAAAIAGVFAYELEGAGFVDANLLVPLVFTLILSTVVAHGFTLSWVSKKLGLAATNNNGVLIVGATLWSVALAKALAEQEIPVVVADTSWHRLKSARLAGLNVYYGQVLSEEAEERMDLSEVGYVLALADNDAFNALVCSRFAHEVGRQRVYQLSILSSNTRDARDLHPSLAGKQLFTQEDTYESLLKCYFSGWEFRVKNFNENYKFEEFVESVTSSYLPILIVHADNSLSFNVDKKLEPKEGDKYLIYHPKIKE